MKYNLLMAAILLTLFSACTKTNIEPPKSQTIKLKQGELFLAVVGYQLANTESLLQDYFGIISLPAEQNGFEPLGQLPIDEIAYGDFRANEFVGLFTWPSLASVQAFLAEVPPTQLNQLRTQIWSELKQHMIILPEDLEMTFHEDKVYEVKMIWNNTLVGESNITQYGGRVLLNSAVTAYEDLGTNLAPTHLLIVEWENGEKAESFRQSNLLQVDKEEAFYTHFDFPEE